MSGKYWLDGRKISSISTELRAMVRSLKISFVFKRNWIAHPDHLCFAGDGLEGQWSAAPVANKQVLQPTTLMFLNIIELVQSLGVEEGAVESWICNDGLPHVTDRKWWLNTALTRGTLRQLIHEGVSGDKIFAAAENTGKKEGGA